MLRAAMWWTMLATILLPFASVIEGALWLGKDGAFLTWSGADGQEWDFERVGEAVAGDCAAVYADERGLIELDSCEGVLSVSAVLDDEAYSITAPEGLSLAALLDGQVLEAPFIKDPPHFQPDDGDALAEAGQSSDGNNENGDEAGDSQRRRKRKAFVNLSPLNHQSGSKWRTQPSCGDMPLGRTYKVRVRAYADHTMYTNFLRVHGNKETAKDAIKSRVRADFEAANRLYRTGGLPVNFQLVLESVKIMVKPIKGLDGLAGRRSLKMNDYLNAFRDKFSRRIGGDVHHITLFSGLENFSVKALEGLSSYAKMCNKEESISMVKYKVRQRAVNLAHEIGHSLGMSHDGENGAGCPSEPRLIMNAYSADVIRWSACSKRQARRWLGCFTCIH